MRKLLILLISVGLLIIFSACGATVRESKKTEISGISGTTQSKVGPMAGYHTYQHDEWIEDTPFGY